MAVRPSFNGDMVTTATKVLIIDGSPIFRTALKEVLQISKGDVQIREASEARKALEIVNRESPAVIFIDIALPEGNGLKLLQEIKRISPQARIIVLTSYDSAEYREASTQRGAEHFLSKEHSGGLRLLDVINETVR